MSKICVKSLEILQISSKILPRSTKNAPKLRKMRSWNVFGAKSRPGRLQVGPPGKNSYSLGAFWVENVAPRVDFWILEKS